jgi:DNA-binding transcriptional MocR family regulator
MNSQQSELQAAEGPAGMLPFIYGHVDPDLFPIDRLRAAAERALSDYGIRALNYGAERGSGPLLKYLVTKLARDEGLDLNEEDLMLTVGASGGLDTICRLFTRPGDLVLVEAPSYHEALDILRDYPVELAGVPLDDRGLMIDALEARLATANAQGIRPSFLYTIPTFQNPSGVTLTKDRRLALLDLAKRYNILIVEDDVYRDLFFEIAPPPSLYALDVAANGQTVIRLGSFSKILSPGLRLGWMLAPPALVTRVIRSGLYKSGGGANPFVAYVTAVFCNQGWLEPHIARLRQVYQHRRDIMLTALKSSMPDGVRWTRPAGGFYVWLTLPEPLRAEEILQMAHRHKITYATGKPFFAEGNGERHIRLPFSFISPPDMERGIYILAKLIQELL